MLIHHGVRGSIPSTSNETSKYGGCTPCVEIRTNEAQLIFDCGTGFSKVQFVENIPTIIFLSHFHHDHIQGLPFNDFNLLKPKPIYLTNGIYKKNDLKNILKIYFSPPFFPINYIEENKFLKFIDFEEISSVLSSFDFNTLLLNHPGKASGYSFNFKEKKICYLLDNEFKKSQENDLFKFCSESEIIIWDGMYTDDEIKSKKGWVHSSIEQGLNFVEQLDVKKLIITHHSPTRTDKQLDEIKLKYSGSNLIIASENEKIDFYG